MWFFSWLRNRTVSREHRAASRFRPALEVTEDRCLLSAGALDTTFGTGGGVDTNLGTIDSAIAYGIAVYHNEGAANEGKIVAVGYADEPYKNGNNWNFAVVRYNPNGSPDTTFNGSGKVTTDFNQGFPDVGNDLAIQPDGKIVAGGYSRQSRGTGYDFAL